MVRRWPKSTNLPNAPLGSRAGSVLRAWFTHLTAVSPRAEDAQRSDVDLWQREITVLGKNGKARIVRISHQTVLSLERYIRVRARHAQAYRPQLWLGVNNRGVVSVAARTITTRRSKRVR